MNIKKIRELFPVTKKYIFLNNAAESPLNLRVKEKTYKYLELALNAPHKKPLVRDDIRIKLSEIFGGSSQDYALMTSTGMGLNIASAGYEWKKGDNVVVPSNEHWNNTFPWQELKNKGVEIRFVDPDKKNRIKPKDIENLMDENTKIVSIAAVSFNTGFRADLKTISDIAHSKKALLVVDAIQGAGALPINVEMDNIDILCSGGFKWLLGMPGTGFMYINKNAQKRIRPVLPGMFSADLYSKDLKYHKSARRYETGSIAYSLFYGWSAGLDIIKEIGVENIHKKILTLTGAIIAGLKEKNIKILSPVENISERSAIIIFTMGSFEKNKALYEKLLSKNIIVTLRGKVIRVSPSFYNTIEEIDTFLKAF